MRNHCLQQLRDTEKHLEIDTVLEQLPEDEEEYIFPVEILEEAIMSLWF